MSGLGYQQIPVDEANETDFSVLLIGGSPSDHRSQIKETRFSPIKATWIGVSIVITCIICLVAVTIPFVKNDNMGDLAFTIRVLIHLLSYVVILVHTVFLNKESSRLNSIGYLATARTLSTISKCFTVTVTVFNCLTVILLAIDVIISQKHSAYSQYIVIRYALILVLVPVELLLCVIFAIRLWHICSKHNRVRPTPDSLSYLDTDGVLAQIGKDTASLPYILQRQAETVRLLMDREAVLSRELYLAREQLGVAQGSTTTADPSLGFISRTQAVKLEQERADAVQELETAKAAAAKREAAIQILQAELKVRADEVDGLRKRLREAQEVAEQRAVLLEIERETKKTDQ